MFEFCLIFSLAAPWETCPRKPFIQQVANVIKNDGGWILCIEPTILSFHTIIFYPSRILKWLKGAYKFRQVEDNIYSYSPLTVEHILLSVRFKPLMWINKYLIKKQFIKYLKQMDMNPQNSIFVLHRPELHFLIGILNEKGAIYDCQDDNCTTSRMINVKVAGNMVREKMLSEKCNFVTTTSKKLFNRNKAYNNNTFLMFNGYSSSLFDNYKYSKIEHLENLKTPVIGYIGAIRDWFDFTLIDYLISKRPEWTFLFVGQVKKESTQNFKKLEHEFTNLVSIKNLSYSEYPNYLQYFDVGIIPFRVNEFMESVNPNKLYEYLGAGIPVVSTNIGDLKEDYSDIVRVGDSKEEFLNHIEIIINMSSTERNELVNKILNHPKRHSWEESANFMFDMIKKFILN